MTPADLLKRARALNNVTTANGASENEAAAAAEALQRLLARHQLDMADVNGGVGESMVDVTRINGKYNESWRRDCYNMAAQMFMCNYFYQTYPGNKEFAVRHCIVGEAHNVAVAIEMGAYFESTINRLANEGSRNAGMGKAPATERHQYIRSFRLAASKRLFSRVREYLERVKAHGITDPETGDKLPALLNLYEHADALYAAWLTLHGVQLDTGIRRDALLSRAGAQAGRSAADKIALNTQVGAAAQKFALPAR